MRYFKVDVRKEPSEYGFMPAMQMYLLEGLEKKRDPMWATRIFILTAAKIFQFLRDTCRIIGQLAPCRKENLNGREHRKMETNGGFMRNRLFVIMRFRDRKSIQTCWGYFCQPL